MCPSELLCKQPQCFYHWKITINIQISVVFLPTVMYRFFFFFFFGHAHGMWKFLGQGSNLLHSSDPSCYSENAGSLTHRTARECQQWTIWKRNKESNDIYKSIKNNKILRNKFALRNESSMHQKLWNIDEINWKKAQINRKLSLAHGLEELILLKCPYYPKPSI